MCIRDSLNPDGVDITCLGKEGAGRLAASVEKSSQGYYGSWNANARGVDLNHNFDAGFSILREMEEKQGIHGPAPRRYSGLTFGSGTGVSPVSYTHLHGLSVL